MRQILSAEVDAGEVAIEQDGAAAAWTGFAEPGMAAQYFGQFEGGAFDQFVQGTSLI
ncbi:hypothetical protein [Acidisphaera sp. S103]|uniref:hypothetical protein n=1 Tax=Acidisphaera sp. S103 TaxID=1747223 RepID=UPI00131AAAC4|nr:hypothetical protein [Acidisphaera sp. S103]